MSPRPTSRPPRFRILALGALSLALLIGCLPLGSGPSQGISSRRFHGWRNAWQLSNGLVRVTCVAGIGGRVLDYSLGETNLLFIGRDALGARPGSRRAGPRPFFGGHFARLHPERKWVAGAASRLSALVCGEYEARPIAVQDGPLTLLLTSPPDLATRTVLKRKIELFPSSTRLRVTTTLRNADVGPADWGIQSVVQLKGSSRRDGITRRDDQPSGRIRLYVPADPRGGVRVLGERSSSGARQWDSASLPGILVLRYSRQLSKAQVRPSLPWVALSEGASGCVFVQKARCERKDILAAGPPLIPYPFVEISCFGPVATLRPAQETTLVEEWFACVCGGPVLDVTEAGVVARPLSLSRGEGKLWVEGRFGVFYLGKAAVVFRDAQGKALRHLECGAVGPLEPLELNRQVELPRGTARIALQVSDQSGKHVGNLGVIVLGG